MGKQRAVAVIIFLLAIGLLAGGLCYLAGRIACFTFWIGRFGQGRAAFLYALALILLLLTVLWLTMGYANAIVCFLHAAAIWLICDGAFWLLRRLGLGFAGRDAVGLAAVVLTAAWLALGWHNAHSVRTTVYELRGNVKEPFRVVLFSDSHVGNLFSGSELAAYVERMNAEKPDAVVIAGDFVDDETSPEDMTAACAALKELKTRCGVYFSFGNHDAGYYSSRRGYGKEELSDCLRANGVRVLEDETVPLTGNIRLCGRRDARGGRKSAEELCADVEKGSYLIMADHCPTDYDAEAAAGASLVLSGHTHGGQFIPIRSLIGRLGDNDRVYGHEKRGNTDFIVSSGLGDWALDFRTGCFSEYVVIDILPE